MKENRISYSYCTLFDVNYLDKGIVSVDSLLKCDVKGNIYILSMDDKTREILCDYYRKYENVIVINLSDFMNEDLKRVKSERSRAEFCWTCTASLIDYVLSRYPEKICTYIDADMFFYSNPDVLVDEMIDNGKSVQIIEHRFKDGFFGRENVKSAGRFCVEFNTFSNEEESLEVLRKWKQDTIEACASTSSDNSNLGDQVYLTEWPNRYTCVNILQNLGAGLAPWNIARYGFVRMDGDVPIVSFDGMGEHKVIFYHFHNLAYSDENTVDINVFKYQVRINVEPVDRIYKPYLLLIDRTKKALKDSYDVYPLLKHHPGIIDKRTVGYYMRRIFSKDVWKWVLMKTRNSLAKRNSDKDIYRINEIASE